MGNCHKWGQRIQECGFRLTIPRQAIIDVLEGNEDHLSAEDIYMKVHPGNPDVGLTTIYRTLDLLEQTGIVVKFDFGHGRAKYELAEGYGEKRHHHHLLCTKCRRIIDYSDFLDEELEYIKKAETALTSKYGFAIATHSINFYGVCPDCSDRGQPAGKSGSLKKET